MKNKIENDTLTIEIPLNREAYWLHFNPRTNQWSINYKIDRSYKGKDPDLGMPIIYLEDNLENKLIKQLKKRLNVIEYSL